MFRNPTTDLIVVLVIVLLIFGPKRLPGLGKQLGQGLQRIQGLGHGWRLGYGRVRLTSGDRPDERSSGRRDR